MLRSAFAFGVAAVSERLGDGAPGQTVGSVVERAGSGEACGCASGASEPVALCFLRGERCGGALLGLVAFELGRPRRAW